MHFSSLPKSNSDISTRQLCITFTMQVGCNWLLNIGAEANEVWCVLNTHNVYYCNVKLKLSLKGLDPVGLYYQVQ